MEEQEEKKRGNNGNNIEKIEFVDLGKKDINDEDKKEKDINYGGELYMWLDLSDQYY